MARYKTKEQKEIDSIKIKDLWINTSMTKSQLARRFGYPRDFIRITVKDIESKFTKPKSKDALYQESYGE